MSSVKKPYKMVLVEWEDAYSDASWHTESQVDNSFLDSSWECKNVGLLVRDEPGYMVLASRWSEINESYGHLQRIPRGMVKRIRRVKV